MDLDRPPDGLPRHPPRAPAGRRGVGRHAHRRDLRPADLARRHDLRRGHGDRLDDDRDAASAAADSTRRCMSTTRARSARTRARARQAQPFCTISAAAAKVTRRADGRRRSAPTPESVTCRFRDRRRRRSCSRRRPGRRPTVTGGARRLLRLGPELRDGAGLQRHARRAVTGSTSRTRRTSGDPAITSATAGSRC